jgi:hypothetical protein
MQCRVGAVSLVAALILSTLAPTHARAGSRSSRGGRSGRSEDDPNRTPEIDHPSRCGPERASTPARGGLGQLGRGGASHEEVRENATRWVDENLPMHALDPVAPEDFARATRNAGAFKVPIPLGEDRLLLVARREAGALSFHSFRDDAIALRELEHYAPTLRPEAMGTVRVGDEVHEAMIVPRLVVGSKDSRLESALKRIDRAQPEALARALGELGHIEEALARNHVAVADLQFLIGKDGRVVIHDPLDVVHEGNPDYAAVRGLADEAIQRFRAALTSVVERRGK